MLSAVISANNVDQRDDPNSYKRNSADYSDSDQRVAVYRIVSDNTFN